MARLREMIGGTLRPRDPRRFLIEAMVGAMHADGTVDARELGVLRCQLEEHELFAGLSARVAEVLIELGTDAVAYAGRGIGRLPAIAQGLTSRTHRLTAYAMVCEVCAADGFVHTAERTYMDALRDVLRIGCATARELEDAAASGTAMRVLEERVERARQIALMMTEILAVKLSASGMVTEAARATLRQFLLQLIDIDARPEVIDERLARALRHHQTRGLDAAAELARVAHELRDPSDRYWCAVYAHAFARSGAGEREFEIALAAELQLSATEQVQAAEDAARLS